MCSGQQDLKVLLRYSKDSVCLRCQDTQSLRSWVASGHLSVGHQSEAPSVWATPVEAPRVWATPLCKRPGSGPLTVRTRQRPVSGSRLYHSHAKGAPVSGQARMWVQPPSMHRPYVTRMVLRKGWAQKGAAARTRRPVSGPPSKKICATNKCTICAKRNGRRGVLLQGECTTGGGTS